MKKLFTLSLVMLAFAISTPSAKSSPFTFEGTNLETDSVVMGAGYANDVFYSLKNGIVATVPRTDWDIAFHTSVFSAAILTNGAIGIDLYCYPKADTSGWNNIDTTGMSTWPVLYNDPDMWENGAFNRHGLAHPDYGWGKYNPISHDLIGDSIFIISLPTGVFKKIWIIRKNSVNNIYTFKYANLDGSDEVDMELNNNDYIDKNFSYFSFSTGQFSDREPAKSTWDLLFTKYKGIVSDQPYPVTGLLNNFNIAANKFTGVGPDYSDWSAMPMDTAKSPIGYDWKYFNGSAYEIIDSIACFSTSQEGNVYKIVFTAFDYMNGKFVFDKGMVSMTGIENQVAPVSSISVSPNPVSDHLTIQLPQQMSGKADVSIYDLSGRQIYSAMPEVKGQQIELKLGTQIVQSGMKLMVVRLNNQTYTTKILFK